jgi:prevent-host-death family protein
MQINILEAKNRLSELVRAAQAGEEIIIANRGRPVARLVSIEEEIPDAPKGSGRAILDWLNSHPLPERARRSAEEIDAGIEEERHGWE